MQAVCHVGDRFWARQNCFQDKFYSLKAHAHYFTVFIYLANWRAAKLGILLILRP